MDENWAQGLAELQREHWGYDPGVQEGMLNTTDAERAALLGTQLAGQQGAPLFGGNPLAGASVGALFGGSPPKMFLYDPTPPEIIDDPLPWVGWSYVWQACYALGALGAWAGFVLFLCWLAR